MLIENWKQALRLYSVQASALGTAAAAAWIALPVAQKAEILSLLGINGPAWLALATFVAVILARLKSQPGLTNDGGGNGSA